MRIDCALGMAIYMGAGPSVMYASHALDAYEQFDEAVSEALDQIPPELAEMMENDELTAEDKAAVLYKNGQRFYGLAPE